MWWVSREETCEAQTQAALWKAEFAEHGLPAPDATERACCKKCRLVQPRASAFTPS